MLNSAFEHNTLQLCLYICLLYEYYRYRQWHDCSSLFYVNILTALVAPLFQIMLTCDNGQIVKFTIICCNIYRSMIIIYIFCAHAYLSPYLIIGSRSHLFLFETHSAVFFTLYIEIVLAPLGLSHTQAALQNSLHHLLYVS